MQRPLGSRMAVLALLALVPRMQVGADMPPPPDSPDSKRVPATIELDWGVFADRVSRRHAIVAGETLRAIAAKELGNAARAKAIAEANPDVIPDPDKIRVGDVIWLPSVKSLESAAKAPTPPPAPAPAPTPPTPPTGTTEPAATELAAWYDGFWLENTGPRGRGPQVLMARATPGEPAKTTLLLVPHPAAGALVTAMAAGPVPVKLAEIPGALIVGMWSDTLVHREDPTVRVVTTYKLTGATGNNLTTDIARVRYDAEGKVVTKEWVVPPPSYEFRDKGMDAKPAPAPTPPAPPGSPTPGEAGMTSATATSTIRVGSPTAPVATDTAPSPDDGSHWPTSTGLWVAIAGALGVGALWIYRRSRTPTPPPPA